MSRTHPQWTGYRGAGYQQSNADWALRNAPVHPSHRCDCARCTEQYNMHYAYDWMGTPADAAAGAPRNTHRHDYDVPAGTVTRNTARW